MYQWTDCQSHFCCCCSRLHGREGVEPRGRNFTRRARGLRKGERGRGEIEMSAVVISRRTRCVIELSRTRCIVEYLVATISGRSRRCLLWPWNGGAGRGIRLGKRLGAVVHREGGIPRGLERGRKIVSGGKGGGSAEGSYVGVCRERLMAS